MLIVNVYVHVKEVAIDDFIAATFENARHSLREPGVARFDVLQQQDDPSRFILVEVYRTAEDPARHKETSHYLKWREIVTDMMEETRHGIKYNNLFPDENGW